MFGYISRQTSSVGARPRATATADVAGGAPRASAGRRQVLGMALVALGQRVAGEMPNGMAPQPDPDCA